MNDRAQQILSELAGTVTRKIIAALGESSIDAIFLAGSAGGGRIAWFSADDRIEIYSDLDLYVITAPGVDTVEARRKARGVIPGLALSTDEYTIYSEPDIGVFDEAGLLAQPDRPGTVEIPLCCRLLYGNGEIAEKTHRFDISRIGREEALYLLENRMMESSVLANRFSGGMRDGVGRWLCYTALKQCLDVMSAILIADGIFVCGLEDRMRLFRERNAATGIVLEANSIDTIEYAYERIIDLQRSLRREESRFDEIRGRSELLLLESWKKIAAMLFRKAPSIGWEPLLGLRCRGDSIPRNLRESVIVSRSCGKGIRTGITLWAAHPKARLSTVPRMAGICELLSRYPDRSAGEPPARFLDWLDSLTAALGFREGNVYERAHALFETTS